MSRMEYLSQLEELLKAGRMAPKDMEDALARCSQYIENAGPEHEEEAVAGLKPPEEMAAEILADYRGRMERKSTGLGWKIALGVLLSPIIIAAYAVVLGLTVGGAVCLIPGILSMLVGLGATLSGGVATLLVFLGGGLAALGAGFLLLLGGIALCQGSNWCMRRLFGGGTAPSGGTTPGGWTAPSGRRA